MQTSMRVRKLKKPHAASGFTLIELMISMVIGLVIVVAAMSAYLGAAGASKISDAQSRMNEDGQAALNLLAHEIRMAGANSVQTSRDAAFSRNPVYSPYPLSVNTAAGTSATYTTTPGTFTISSFSIRGCDGTFTNVTATTATNLDALTCSGTTSTLPDSIAINYEADKYNTTVSSSGTGTDCLGNAVPTISATYSAGTATTATFGVADNRFYIGYIGNNTSRPPTLYCKGNSNSTQPLVENIEDLQFQYGTRSTSTTSTTATIAGYLAASDITALTTAPNDDATRWSKVLTVRICVVVRSENPVAPDAASASYIKCDGTRDTTKTDLRLRRAYSTVVVLRNRQP
jgi:type IV pilus assembly protein PilW